MKKNDLSMADMLLWIVCIRIYFGPLLFQTGLWLTRVFGVCAAVCECGEGHCGGRQHLIWISYQCLSLKQVWCSYWSGLYVESLL